MVDAAVGGGGEVEWRRCVGMRAPVPQLGPRMQDRRVLGRLVRAALRVVQPQQAAVVVLQPAVRGAKQLATYQHTTHSALLTLHQQTCNEIAVQQTKQ